MSYNKETVKEALELEDIYSLLEYLDGEPQMINDYIVCKTICHGGDSHKLYYYDNTALCKCYTGDCGTFDIFDLVSKVKDVELNDAINFVVHFFNLNSRIEETDIILTEDWKYLRRLEHLFNMAPDNNERLLLPECSDSIIKYYPNPEIANWTEEGISKEVCDYMGIKYDPVQGGILIPHKDQYDRTVGIRIRTLVEEQEEFGKYKPWRNNGKLYNHPLAFNLYGLNKAQENIKKAKTAIIVESEKSVLQFISYFGLANNMCVAVCGSSISKYQFGLLQDLGISELVVAFDRDFEEPGSQEYYDLQKKWEKIHRKYGNWVNVSFLWDKDNLLSYKSSPLDHGAKAFEYLFRNRIYL